MKKTNDTTSKTTSPPSSGTNGEATSPTSSPRMRLIQGGNQPQPNSTGQCLAFAEAARRLAAVVNGSKLVMPSFCSPPRKVGSRRTLSRHGDGSVTVSVMVRNRVWEAVMADMIEGVVVANHLDGTDAESVRDQLWEALQEESTRRETA